MKRRDKALSIFLIVAIAAALGSITYMTITPKKSDKFTEFYILGPEGKAQDYPKQAIAGKPIDIVIGVVNHEYQPTSYKVGIDINGIKASEVNIGTLSHQQKWEENVSFTFQLVGERQRVDFHLYKNGENEPYLKEPLRLFLDVVSP